MQLKRLWQKLLEIEMSTIELLHYAIHVYKEWLIKCIVNDNTKCIKTNIKSNV